MGGLGESFAHYLHIRDTAQTAAAYGLVVEGPDAVAPAAAPLQAVPRERPTTFDEIVATWLPLTYALNAVNRSMGAADLYPFVLVPTVLAKLRFVHDLVDAHLPYRTPGEAVADDAGRAQTGTGTRLRATASSARATTSTDAVAVQKPPTTSVG